ncbi:unnamed protein product [Urochloa decumbens]|uniref:Uncharacterized protein n=1 Tax=Urochloa decumbens TaxID=240449 RepID=A0ABC9ESM5_9POAL
MEMEKELRNSSANHRPRYTNKERESKNASMLPRRYCIGSAFNARGTMQCPNCRDTEEGDWLSANSFQPSTDSSSHFGNGVTWGRSYPVSNFLAQSPIGGSIPISSDIEGGPTADLSSVQVSGGTEPRNEIEHPHFAALRMVHLAHRHTNPFGVDVQRYIGSSQQRSTQPAPRSRGTYVASGHGLRGRVIQQTVSPATRSTPYPPPTSIRVRPWALSMASSSVAAEDMESHHPGAVAANVQSSGIPNQDKASRRDQP